MLQFSDRYVSYETFLHDVAEVVVEVMTTPEYISQNEAFRRYGRANVERWRKQGKVEPCKRKQKLEYRTADLRRLKATKQDYLNPKPKNKIR